MARPTYRRTYTRLLIVAAFVLLGSACSASPTWVQTGPLATEQANGADPSESATAPEADAAPTAIVASQPVVTGADTTTTGQPPSALAFADNDVEAAAAFCTASSNILVRTEALSRVGADANPELTEVALSRIAEWMERATLSTEVGVESRVLLFGAFQELRETVARDHGLDWVGFTVSDAFADSPAGVLYVREHAELTRFVNEDCVGLSLDGLEEDIEAQAAELAVGWGTEASPIAASESLPGHSIFTHTSGRLIASFPGHWEHRELSSGDAVVDFVAARGVEAMLAIEPGEGVHIQLVEVTSLDELRELMTATGTAQSCETESDTLTDGRIATVIQDQVCDDHVRYIEGRYNADRDTGLIVEASFRGDRATSPQLTRLASVLQSILWS